MKVRNITTYMETNGTLVIVDQGTVIPINGSYAEIRGLLKSMLDQLDEHEDSEDCVTPPGYRDDGTQLELF